MKSVVIIWVVMSVDTTKRQFIVKTRVEVARPTGLINVFVGTSKQIANIVSRMNILQERAGGGAKGGWNLISWWET